MHLFILDKSSGPGDKKIIKEIQKSKNLFSIWNDSELESSQQQSEQGP